MKKLLYGVFAVAMIASLGCAITNYPIIEDTRGDYVGVIRTAHKAYIIPSGQVATIWSDGTDELFTMVYQNQYGDQKLYTFNNYDPSGAVSFLDQTYCDWRYANECAAVEAWNPSNDFMDDVFDYVWNTDCSGARSLSLLVSYTFRIGECGDGMFADKQGLAAVFSNLGTTTWRGQVAYIVPMNAGNTQITLTSTAGLAESMPMYGSSTAFITERLQLAVPMTPNMRHQLNWTRAWAAQNGNVFSMSFNYEGLEGTLEGSFVAEGLSHNAGRF